MIPVTRHQLRHRVEVAHRQVLLEAEDLPEGTISVITMATPEKMAPATK
jgi:hypothetical protein